MEFKHYNPSKRIKQTYICPDCFRVKEVETEISGASEDDDIRLHSVNYTVYCKDCDNYMFECDTKLADTIIELNKCGLSTMYSCIGHHRDDDFYGTPDVVCSVPYVAFTENVMDVVDKVPKNEEYDKYITTSTLNDMSTVIQSRVFDCKGNDVFSPDYEEGTDIPKSNVEKSGDVLISFLQDMIKTVKEGL